jgi:hypothetical protein
LTDAPVFLQTVGEYQDVVKVHRDDALDYEVQENLIHHVWKVPGLFVRPKYITKGLKSPWFVRKAAFHSSPSFI